MIPAEQANAYIKSKKLTSITKLQLEDFSETYKGLGLIITKLSEYYNTSNIDIDVNRYEYDKYFKKDYVINPWKTEEGQRLSILLFGEFQAFYIATAWDLISTTPYQDSYDRRSFRTTPNETYVLRKIDFFQHLYKNGRAGYAAIPISELIQYDCYNQRYYNNNSYLFAAAFQHEDPELITLVNDIFQGEDEIGGVTRSIIKGLLLTNKQNNWVLVEKLLLAAQRQEGLRQTILESLDETSIGALHHFMKVIVDNDLMRFSSVVRAVDTWFGFEWDAPKKATVKRVLELSYSLMKDKNLVLNAVKSKDNLEVYVALWVIALVNADAANLSAIQLIKTGTKDKKILAAMFINETQRTNTELIKWIEPNLGNDIELDYWVLTCAPQLSLSDDLFQKLKDSASSLPNTGKVVEGQVFPWTKYTIKPDFFYKYMILFANEEQTISMAKNISEIPSEKREEFLKNIFPDHFSYYFQSNKELPKIDLDNEPWKRDLVHQAIKDRNESVMATGLQILNAMDLNQDDFFILEDILSRKSVFLRSETIKLIIAQENNKIEHTIKNLLQSKKVNQRLGGLELLSILHEEEKLIAFTTTQIALYSERKSFSKNEEVFLEKFSTETGEFTFENGFGVIDYENLSPIITPQIKFKAEKKSMLTKVLSKSSSQNTYLFPDLVDTGKVITAINALVDLFEEHKNDEYTIHYPEDGSSSTVLFNQHFDLTKSNAYKLSKKEQLDYLPLADVWKTWYKNANLNDFELQTAVHYSANYNARFSNYPQYIPFIKQYIPELKGLKLTASQEWNSLNSRINSLLNYFFDAYKDHKTLIHYKVDQIEDMIARLPEDLKALEFEVSNWDKSINRWYDFIIYEGMGAAIDDTDIDYIDKKGENPLKRLWDLQMYLLMAKLSYPNTDKDIKEIAVIDYNKKDNFPHPPTWLTVYLHQQQLITDDDFKYQCLINISIIDLLEGRRNYRNRNSAEENLPNHLMHPLKENLLKIELERGDLATEATRYTSRFMKIKKTEYLIELLKRMGKETFNRGYYWGSDSSLKSSFSSLIKRSFPNESDTITNFISLAKDAKIPKKRWVEVAMYAPQWTPWIGEFLSLNKLEDAVWWFQAHASDYMDAEKETIISRYSNIEKNDFIKGAIDIDWFNEIYQDLGKQNWKLLHDAAKYISDGNGHRQVKLYSGVMLGEIKIRETLAKIKDKRDKDYVKALGLIPLSKTNKEKDLLTRYNLLQVFLKESKQFGAQRQESEKNAVEIALDNLSRNAGYEDSIRFSWAMEAKATQQIMDNAILTFDDTEITLFIDTNGKADIKVVKNGKSQKSIPVKYKKEKTVLALINGKNYLKKQYSRTRISLENAMIREDEFTAAEIYNIMLHPVVKALLSKLILFNKENATSGFWDNDKLVNAEKKPIVVNANDRFIIAHPSHLYQSVEWDLYQRFAFDTSLVQPFKQIFRELYLVTKDEIEAGTSSERYQGHQIQPKKTVALLRSRGWTVSNEEGLQKVYHKKGFIATIYAMADWYSPSDIEAPTLEQLCFYSRKDYKSIPLKDIDPVTFSEVMRDLDLVVSVAHVGGVDPEASHSTLQMRGVLAKESARLFKLDNITVKERHILIKGKLASYSIHLGSGIISKNGLQLSIIPVHSQHRGRIFLPFIDDDPKSAEIISKMKMLADDNKIKDPTILAQINS